MSLFPERLKELISRNNFKYKEIERATGIKHYTINAYVNGKAQPDMEAIISLCIFFNVSSDYLVGLSDTYYPDKITKKIKEIEKAINHQVENFKTTINKTLQDTKYYK